MSDISRRQLLKIGGSAVAWELLPGGRAFAAPLWVDERQFGPFMIYSTFPLGPYESLFAELPLLQRELRSALAIAPPREPIYVHLLGDRKQHETYVRERFPSIPYRRALYVKHGSQSSVFAYRQAELSTDLRHECTHALLHGDILELPLWLDEGLAEYFETPSDRRIKGSPHFDELTLNLRLGIVVDVESLEAKRELAELTALDYRFAWAWSHYLLLGPAAAYRELAAFLVDLRRGSPAGKLSERIAEATPRPNEQLVRHLRQWQNA